MDTIQQLVAPQECCRLFRIRIYSQPTSTFAELKDFVLTNHINFGAGPTDYIDFLMCEEALGRIAINWDQKTITLSEHNLKELNRLTS